MEVWRCDNCNAEVDDVDAGCCKGYGATAIEEVGHGDLRNIADELHRLGSMVRDAAIYSTANMWEAAGHTISDAEGERVDAARGRLLADAEKEKGDG